MQLLRNFHDPGLHLSRVFSCEIIWSLLFTQAFTRFITHCTLQIVSYGRLPQSSVTTRNGKSKS